MSALPDGRELLCTLAWPLPLQLSAELMAAIADVAERNGYDGAAIEAGTGRVLARKTQPCYSVDMTNVDQEGPAT